MFRIFGTVCLFYICLLVFLSSFFLAFDFLETLNFYSAVNLLLMASLCTSCLFKKYFYVFYLTRMRDVNINKFYWERIIIGGNATGCLWELYNICCKFPYVIFDDTSVTIVMILYVFAVT